ncbi:MAG: hypothetical protein LC775_05820, partial [Acidobacteria bacterium]|nr:hypothetical protein [Acidobacteriota bacterium]
MRPNSPGPINRRKTVYPLLRFGAAAGLFIVFLLLIWSAGRSGLSSLLSNYGAGNNQVDAINAAVNLSPDDPGPHYLRGTVLEANGELGAAVSEYRDAASLRPDDYVLWLSLAHACELNGDTSCALAAAKQALALAPYYAQPHWQLGNLLVRMGQQDDGLKELRLAASSDPTLLPVIIDLAWQLSRGDVDFVKQAIRPETPESYKALAVYFKNRGEFSAASAMFHSAGRGAEHERQQYVNELIGAKQFKEAYALWATSHTSNSENIFGALRDPGFEQENNLEEPGFGWRRDNKAPSMSLSLDDTKPGEGRYSLRVDFKGDSDPRQPIVSQLVLVEPGTHYQLHFAVTSEHLVSGGLPKVYVIDVGNNTLLGQTSEFPQQTNNWQDYTIDFKSTDQTSAVRVSLQRESCSESPCPIFGVLRLD